jgi:hypothetical protein
MKRARQAAARSLLATVVENGGCDRISPNPYTNLNWRGQLAIFFELVTGRHWAHGSRQANNALLLVAVEPVCSLANLLHADTQNQW